MVEKTANQTLEDRAISAKEKPNLHKRYSTINLALANKDKKTELFVSSNPDLKKLTFTLSNNSKEPLSLVGGEAAPPCHEKSGPSSICIFLDRILDQHEIKTITLSDNSGPAWSLVTYTGNYGQTYLAVAPKKLMICKPGHRLSFELTGITPKDQNISGEFVTLFLIRVPNQNPISRHILFDVIARKEPPLGIGLIGPPHQIYVKSDNYEVTNNFSICLRNLSDKPLVENATLWGDASPQFKLEFTTMDNSKSKTQALGQDVSGMEINLDGDLSDGWETQNNSQQSNWKFTPIKAENPEILPGGKSLVFSCNELVTDFDPGMTPAHLYYRDIPGYKNGRLTFLLEKSYLKTPLVELFYMELENYQVRLNWTVSACEYCTLIIDSQEIDGRLPIKGSHLFSPTKQETICYLNCFNGPYGSSCTKRIKVTVPLPEIQRLDIDKKEIKSGEAVNLDWHIKNTKDCILYLENIKIGDYKPIFSESLRSDFANIKYRQLNVYDIMVNYRLVCHGFIDAEFTFLRLIVHMAPVVRLFRVKKFSNVLYFDWKVEFACLCKIFIRDQSNTRLFDREFPPEGTYKDFFDSLFECPVHDYSPNPKIPPQELWFDLECHSDISDPVVQTFKLKLY